MTNETMNLIKTWRENCQMTQRELSDRLNIPMRTLQSWELGERKCPEWAEALLIEKLQRITEERLTKKVKDFADHLKSDEEGHRPELVWGWTEDYRDDSYSYFADSMADAMKYAPAGSWITIFIRNEGTTDFTYEDRKGAMHSSDEEGFRYTGEKCYL